MQFGEAVVQGQPVYLSTVDSKWYKCDANDTLAKAACAGIVLTPAAISGYGLIATPSVTAGISLVNLGATLAIGTQYAVSTTLGGVAPLSDIASTQFPTSIGFATTTALLDFQVTICSVAKA